MRPYYEDASVTIYHGDVFDVIEAAGTVDALITDPPYSSGARRDADRQVRGAMLRSMKERGEDWFSHDTMTTWGFRGPGRHGPRGLRPGQ